MLFSVEDMARCQAVCNHNGARVAALIKLFIHIIILRRIQASQTKLLGIGDFCAVGPRGTFGRWAPSVIMAVYGDTCDKRRIVHF